MQIPLSQFEQYIDESILKRGLLYFKNGHVQELEELSPGEYEAIVQSTENYTIHLTIDNDIITDYYCNCPYDMGPVCKHVASVIFFMQKEKLELNKKTKKTKSTQKTKTIKSKTVKEQ